MFLGQIIGSLIPLIDIRDVIANLIHEDYLFMGLSAAGLLPCLGDSAKITKKVSSFISKNLDNIPLILNSLEVFVRIFPDSIKLFGRSDELIQAATAIAKQDVVKITRRQAETLNHILKNNDMAEFMIKNGDNINVRPVLNGSAALDDVVEGGSKTIAKYGDDFGKMGTYVVNPKIKVDWSQYAEHAAERMKQRGMTQELIDDIVNNGKVLSQNGGNKFAYITQDGVAIVSKDGKLITAWGKSNFDENMLDVISKLFGE